MARKPELDTIRQRLPKNIVRDIDGWFEWFKSIGLPRDKDEYCKRSYDYHVKRGLI